MAASIRSLVNRKYREVCAVDGISFEISPGEVIGFLGPNGAGKTTTLKMLSGLLVPSAGIVEVLGRVPYERKRSHLRDIALVMGNRNQLHWDLPAADSYELNRSIYRIPRSTFQRTKSELVDLLEIGDLIRKPVRSLSLGERMKVELVGSLLHLPRVLFLDEPTLGLDVSMQRKLREFIVSYNLRHGSTILLTSHYMADVEALCERVIVIQRGTITYDGMLDSLASSVAAYKEIMVKVRSPSANLHEYGLVSSADGDAVRLRVAREETASIVGALLADEDVVDLTVEDPPLDEVMELVFNSLNSPAR
ncbi:ABC transporter ATP-binding protein [Nocardia gipuzkoensis]